MPEVYQQTMEQFFGDLEGVEIYFDDFFVWGTTREEHDRRLKAVFDRCLKVRLKLNAKSADFYNLNCLGSGMSSPIGS